MGARARDVMQGPVVSVSPETSLADVVRLFAEEQIHGAPVISDDGEVVGVISMSDLIGAAMNDAESGGLASDYLRELVEFSAPDWASGESADFQDRLRQTTAAEVMTSGAATVPASAPVGEVAALMYQSRIHRVWVVERGGLVGVISTFDLLPLVAKANL